MNKPLSQCTLAELTSLVEKNGSDRATLESIFDELCTRSSYDARTLRKAVKGQLDDLPAGPGSPAEGPRTATDEPHVFGLREGADLRRLAVLEKMRERLLDLTGNKPLLNYRHPRTRSLRLIDEVPSKVFTRLLSNGPMTFVPLDEYESVRARTGNPGMLDQDNEGQDTEIDMPEDVDPEEAIRIRRRHERKAKQQRLESRRRAVAKAMGLGTGFDLGTSRENRTRRDSDIQTMLFPSELEKVAHTLFRGSLTAIQESGANMLHLMFGFLEWKDVNTGEGEGSSRLAPLVLLPVSLTKGGLDPSSQTYRYQVAPTGEDWDTNITLQVKCRKEFAFEIPQIDPDQDETLDSYFRRVEAAIAPMKGWKLRRMVTLGLVSFGKILMWRDLDVKTWPDESPLLDNRVLRDILGEAGDEESLGAGDPIIDAYEIDNLPPELQPEPVLVTEADSSQHSVLVDVQRGKDIVVQGPPGTGKSQTITNLIGNALASGKKVLFIAEKKAALDVVHKRLREADLGPFCLALHSHTSQKREFLDALVARLALRGETGSVRHLDQTRSANQEARDELNRYVRRLHTPFAAVEWTPFEIFWRGRRRLEEIGGEAAKALDDVRIDGALEINERDFGRRRSMLGRFAAEFEAVKAQVDDLSKHPWAGVRSDSLAYDDVERVIKLADRWHHAIDRLGSSVETGRAATGTEWPATVSGLMRLADSIRELKPPATSVSADLPRAIAESASQPELQRAIGAVSEARSAWQRVPRNWQQKDGIDQVDADRFESILFKAEDEFEGVITSKQLAVLKNDLLSTATAAEVVDEFVSRVTSALELSLPRTVDVAERLVAVVELLGEIDDAALTLRSSSLRKPEAGETVRALRDRADALRARSKELDARFDIAMRPEKERLRAQVADLSTAPRFLPSVFSRGYREAVKAFRAMTGQRASREDMVGGMRELLGHVTALDAFERNADLLELFGPHASGIESPFDRALAVIAWRDKVASICRSLDEHGQTLENSLWNAEPIKWREAEAFLRSSPDAHAAAPLLRDQLSKATAALRKENLTDREIELLSCRDRLKQAAAYLSQVEEVFQSAGADDTGVSVQGVLDWLGLYRQAVRAEQEIGRYEELFRSLGVQFRGLDTQVQEVVAALSFLHDLREARLPAGIERWIIQDAPRARCEELKTIATAIATAGMEARQAAHVFGETASLDLQEWLAPAGVGEEASDSSEVPLALLSGRLEAALVRRDTLHTWASYQHRTGEAKRAGLARICEIVEGGRVAPSHAADAFEAAFCRSLAEAILRSEPGLGRFAGASHERVREEFKQLDHKLIQDRRRQIAHDLNSEPGHPGVGWGRVADLTDEALIRREAEKTRRHIPIRQLFRRAGRAILGMKPCFLMGPQAVAQYLTPGLFDFDLIIMDEASQMRPEDALGAIARGQQLVVVGDPKQLGPTRFFDRVLDDDDELEEEVAAAFGGGRDDDEVDDGDKPLEGASVLERSESILHAAAARFPTRMLRWHYRSRHPKLIAFSNKEFYGENLVLFPTPGSGDENDGVFFRQVDDGVYEALGRKNAVEARAVVDAIKDHARDFPHRSLMVATLNAVQARLIDDMVEAEEKVDPLLADFRQRHAETLEPFDVKNLENVQGDERDVVMVSVTFGRTSKGQFRQNFGPINGKGGERRLNVLFTRAKHRLEVFCSFDPSDLRVAEDSPRGLSVFRDYLRYAQGADWASGKETGRPADSDFEVAVASALEARGFDVRCQIGVAGYFIDLGVIHPDHPGRFILGVECDGATYHSTRTARDRDRLREQVLTTEFGWRIHRVWSTDWFRNPVEQTNRIVEVIDRIVENERSDPGRPDWEGQIPLRTRE